MKIQTVFCILACLGMVTSDATYYCGRSLATALDYFCEGHLIKRSDSQGSRFSAGFPGIEASRAYSLTYRRKRGVVDECCTKPCTVNELMTYCH